MKTCIPLDRVLLVGLLSLPAASETRAERVPEPTLESAESRLRAIYDRNEFRAKQFRADWLPDSTGYTVMEPAPDGKEQVRVRYDAASGTSNRPGPAAERSARPIRRQFPRWPEHPVLRTGESVCA